MVLIVAAEGPVGAGASTLRDDLDLELVLPVVEDPELLHLKKFKLVQTRLTIT